MKTSGCVRILDEGQDARAVLHRARFAGDLATAAANILAGLVDVLDFQSDVAVSGTQLIVLDAPVVGQLDHTVMRLVAVTDEGQGELAVRIILAAQQGHAQHLGVEGDGFVQIADTQHGMQQSHQVSPFQKAEPRHLAGVLVRQEVQLSRPLKNVGEAGKARQKRLKKRSLRVVNEHFDWARTRGRF